MGILEKTNYFNEGNVGTGCEPGMVGPESRESTV